MNNQEETNQETSEKETKTRKRKILTDPESSWTNRKVCKEPGNLENLIRHGLEVKNELGIVLYGAFEYVYFCSENCKSVVCSLNN